MDRFFGANFTRHLNLLVVCWLPSSWRGAFKELSCSCFNDLERQAGGTIFHIFYLNKKRLAIYLVYKERERQCNKDWTLSLSPDGWFPSFSLLLMRKLTRTHGKLESAHHGHGCNITNRKPTLQQQPRHESLITAERKVTFQACWTAMGSWHQAFCHLTKVPHAFLKILLITLEINLASCN